VTNYLIIGGTILVLISAIAVFALVGGKNKDVAGSAGVVNGKAVSRVATGKVVKNADGMTLILGPFSEEEIIGVAVFGLNPILQHRTMENNILAKTNFDETASSVKYLCTEKGVDEIGVSRNIHVVEVHLVGEYRSKFDNMIRSFDVTFVAHALKIDYGMGFKVLSTEAAYFKPQAM